MVPTANGIDDMLLQGPGTSTISTPAFCAWYGNFDLLPWHWHLDPYMQMVGLHIAYQCCHKAF